MIPRKQFLRQPKHFWANVRTISQAAGYTEKRTHRIKIPKLAEMKAVLMALDLSPSHILDGNDRPTPLGKTLHTYFKYRADVLNTFVEPRLMTLKRAKQEFETLRTKLC